MANTGTLSVAKGTLKVDGAVTGAGVVGIGGGTADFASPFTENVTFTSAGGVLELALSQSYTGQISGFSKTGASSLLLLDINGASATASYSGTTTSGVLTVTDGSHTARITLIVNYTTSTFTVTDVSGAAEVKDPSDGGAGPAGEPGAPDRGHGQLWSSAARSRSARGRSGDATAPAGGPGVAWI